MGKAGTEVMEVALKMSTEKQQLWEQKLRQIDCIRDGLGKGLDAGIRETVGIFQIFGLQTSQSCEGHIGWGIPAPWIDLDSPEARILGKKRRKLYKKMETMEEGTAEFEQICKERNNVWEEEDRLQALEVKKLFPYLEEFYERRNVSYERRIMIDSRGRIISQGVVVQAAENTATQLKKLHGYQEEMNVFTEFLKQKFFSK